MQIEGVERVEHNSCDGDRTWGAAAVAAMCEASKSEKRVSAARAEELLGRQDALLMTGIRLRRDRTDERCVRG